MTNHKSLVSVIVPAYNAERFLSRTLTSVLGQTHRNLEVVVVDDGSTDGTAAVAENFAAVDERVRVLRQKNSGAASARNHALQEVRGDFVAPLDADDVWHPEYITRQLEALQAAGPQAAVAYSWYLVIDGGDNFMAVGPRTKFRKRESVQSALINDNFIGNGSSTLIRVSAIRNVQGYDGCVEGCEDWALHLALAEHWDFAVVPRFLVAYRSHSRSMSKSRRPQMERSRRLLRAKIDRDRADRLGYLFGRSTLYLDESVVVAALKCRNWKLAWSTLYRLNKSSGADFLHLIGRLAARFGNYIVRKTRPKAFAPRQFWVTHLMNSVSIPKREAAKSTLVA